MDLEILEALALAGDRAAALAQLLPGSEDHDYYRALHAQQRGAFDEAATVIDAWPERHGRTERYERLRLRQLLYRVTRTPDAVADQVRDRFGVGHWHEAEVEEVDPSRPTRLADGAFDPAALLREAYGNDTNLSQVTDEGLYELLDQPLDATRRRVLLGRIGHTPQPEVVALVAEELAQRGSGGFGSLAIHDQLTREQLVALAHRAPELRGHAGWVAAVVRRMRPPASVDLAYDSDARAAYLDELWRFVADLPPVHNSLKAHVLWHLLDTARRRGATIDGALFAAYLALPRSASYLPSSWIEKTRRDEIAQLGQDFRAVTGLPPAGAPAGSDDELVRDILHHRLDLAEQLAQWFDRKWLDAEIATAQLLYGVGDPDRATLTLGPARAAALRERIDLAWCPDNPTRFAADAPIVLCADVKHVAELVVKVFRIDPLAYFQHHHREVDTALDLDGLAASHELVLRFAEPPVRRVRRTIELPMCARPGVYVIDLIGNGIASRALVQKGRLRHATRVGAAGHVITILDEAGRPRPEARAWIGDREYVADERGTIVVPFSTRPGRTPMLLSYGDIASVADVDLVAEQVAPELTLLLDRQSLTAGRTAKAVARLAIEVGGAPASLALLKQPMWDLTLTDRQGVATTKSQPLVVTDDDATVLEWPLGEDTASITLSLRARVEIRSEQREQDISVTRHCEIATMHAGLATEALYLAHTDAGWVVSALGKSGEPRARRPVTIGLVHRYALTKLTAELATDERGRVELGQLPGVTEIMATLGGLTQTWNVDAGAPRERPLHALAGRDVVVAIPATRSAADVLRRASLVELRGNAPARHVTPTYEPLASAIAIRGLSPGEYQLRAPGIVPASIVVVAASEEVAGCAIATGEIAQVPRSAPAIASISDAGGELRIVLRGAVPRTRVHVVATRFAPAPTEALAEGPTVYARRRIDRAPGARYVSGRELGDEYRYVLDRRSAKRFPNLLVDKPSLLLNPWARRTTTTDVATARPGGAFAAAGPMMSQAEYGGIAGPEPVEGSEDAFVSYDFLAAAPVVLANLVPTDGVVAIAKTALGDATTVTIVVDDTAGTAVRHVALAESPLAPRDLRLRLALDPDRHATQKKVIAPLASGERLVIDDIATAKLHLIDSVERAHAYLLALGADATLRELAFVTRWHALPDDERRRLYSKYACHELHLFLYFKDRAFFDAVVRPYLAHKRTKTFVDHWLLDADLAPYAAPDQLVRLNTFERALLAHRITTDDALARQLADDVAVLPPDPTRDTRLIDALLGASTLDGDAGIEQAKGAALDRIETEVAAEMEVGAFTGRTRRVMAAPAPPPGAAPKPMMKKKAERSRGAKADLADDELARDLVAREEAKPMFRPADKTQEWAEHNWWHRTPGESGAQMIAPNRLWRDFAARTASTPFLSPALGLATGSFAEAMCALAVTDLPFVAPPHAIVADGPRLTITAAGNALAGSAQLVDGELVTTGAPLVVGTSYVRTDDRHDWSTGEQVDKYVEGAFAAGVVYTCLVVLANPTSSRQRIAALIQIPRGSIAVGGAQPTHTIEVVLEPYATHGHEYSFYFPAPGRWTHFPVHVSRGGQIIAAAPGRTLDVQAGGAAPDPRSWSYLSQRGALADVVAFLATANLSAIELPRVAWRLRDRAAYDAILGVLERRRRFDETLWGYALLHRDAPRIRVLLRSWGERLLAAGPVLEMLGLDAEDLGSYEHLELAPLINARAHRLGPKLRILNDGLAAQYQRFLELVSHRKTPSAEDLLAAAHYLLAQDRVEPALATLGRVDPASIADRMQADYLAAYAACLTGDVRRARELAQRWREHPVDRWRHKFSALAAMLDEVDGAAPSVVDPRSREQQQAELAAKQPAFDIALDREGIVIHSQHVAELELRFFEMDVELLFSRQPFVQSDVSRFSFIEPGHRLAVAPASPEQRIAWPAALRGKNVVVEAVGSGIRKAKVHYANDLVTNLAHQYGQIRVQRASDRSVLAATYVKVYARKHGGAVTFYKDGYTDLRGWFDYASLSTTELDAVERFALLVCSDQAGAAILEAAPPAR